MLNVVSQCSDAKKFVTALEVVEVDDGSCQSMTVLPGVGASCTITNTRLYEGIPTLSQYGLALMALLMLGVGFVAFRRIG